jgi:signal transduction histidine kinase
VLEDRERIGRDMHDTVIGRLFAAGMGIQASIGYLNDPVLQERFSALVDEIDTSINEIRTTIYGIRSQPDWGEGLRGRILEVAAKRSRPLGFEPTIDLHGPIDDLPMHIGDDLLATIQEALSNIAKHARANAVIINVEVTTTHLDVRIEDDGVGISATSGVESQTPLTGHGVANMTARAETLNGTATISSTPGHGTTISWTIPLP